MCTLTLTPKFLSHKWCFIIFDFHKTFFRVFFGNDRLSDDNYYTRQELPRRNLVATMYETCELTQFKLILICPIQLRYNSDHNIEAPESRRFSRFKRKDVR